MNKSKDHPTIFQSAPVVDVSVSQSFSFDEGTVINDGQGSTGDNVVDNNVECAGQHFIVDFWGAKFLQDVHVLESALTDAAHVAGAVLLHIHLHKFASGGGVTGVALLAESHISVHTWPEREYAAFDVFMCGGAKPERAVALLEEVFKPSRVNVHRIVRGEGE